MTLGVGSGGSAGAYHPVLTLVGCAAMTGSIEVVINGQARAVNVGTTIGKLIADLGLGDRKVAVERNRNVVPRAEHATTELVDGDRLEVVTFVGGG